MDTGLGHRLFEFAVKIIKYCRKLPRTKEFDVIRYQLTKSATSSGANYEEAQSASSRADFKSKIDISLREMRESNNLPGEITRYRVNYSLIILFIIFYKSILIIDFTG